MPRPRKLTDAEVKRIRELWAEGYTQKSIAAAFGVSSYPVYEIIRGKRWVEAGGPIDPPPPWHRQMARDQWRRPLDPAALEKIQ